MGIQCFKSATTRGVLIEDSFLAISGGIMLESLQLVHRWYYQTGLSAAVSGTQGFIRHPNIAFGPKKPSQRTHEIATWLITRSKIPHTILVVSIVPVAWANLNCVVVVIFRSPSCFADMSLEMVLSSVGLSTFASEWSGLN